MADKPTVQQQNPAPLDELVDPTTTVDFRLAGGDGVFPSSAQANVQIGSESNIQALKHGLPQFPYDGNVETAFALDFANSGVSLLPPYFTHNGQTVEAWFRYEGKDATDTEWPAVIGDTLVDNGGTGRINQPTGFLDGSQAVACDGSLGYSGDLDPPGSDDFILELVYEYRQTPGSFRGIFRLDPDALGTTRLAVSTHASNDNQLIQYVDGVSSAVNAGAPTSVDGSLIHMWVVVDSSGSMVAYRNAQNGAARSISHMGDLVDGGIGLSNNGFAGKLILAQGFKAPTGWLPNHLVSPAARVERMLGLLARDGSRPSLLARSGPAYTDLEQGDGTRKLFRFDTNTIRLAKRANITGALIEEASTNLALYSNDLSQSDWTATNATGTAAQAEAPNLETEASALSEDATASVEHKVVQTVTVVDATTYTLSAFAKAGERDWLSLQESSASAAAWFDLANAAVGTETNCTAEIEDWGDGWVRCWITYVTSGTSSDITVALADADNSTSFNGLNQVGCYLWCVQCEAYQHPTSPIPTEATTDTRGTDTYEFDLNLPDRAHLTTSFELAPARTYSQANYRQTIFGMEDVSNNNNLARLLAFTSGAAARQDLSAEGLDGSSVWSDFVQGLDIADGGVHTVDHVMMDDAIGVTYDDATAAFEVNFGSKPPGLDAIVIGGDRALYRLNGVIGPLAVFDLGDSVTRQTDGFDFSLAYRGRFPKTTEITVQVDAQNETQEDMTQVEYSFETNADDPPRLTLMQIAKG